MTTVKQVTKARFSAIEAKIAKTRADIAELEAQLDRRAIVRSLTKDQAAELFAAQQAKEARKLTPCPLPDIFASEQEREERELKTNEKPNADGLIPYSMPDALA